jgi:Zn-finger nucleic acid-binding protein
VSEPVCPLCAGSTSLKGWGEIAGFRCGKCDADFIRAQPLEEFLKENHRRQVLRRLLEKAREARPSVRPLRCPDCRTHSYHTANVHSLALDICVTCGGLYFDRGEAEAWLAHLKGRNPPRRDVDNDNSSVGMADIILALFLGL